MKLELKFSPEEIESERCNIPIVRALALLSAQVLTQGGVGELTITVRRKRNAKTRSQRAD